MATAKKENVIVLKQMEIKEAVIRIVGDSPLIMHAWSHKAKQEMLDKQMGVKKAEKKANKNPFEDFAESLYWITGKPEKYDEDTVLVAANAGDSRWGFPATAFKQAMCSTAYRSGWEANQMGLRGGLFIVPDDGDLVEIKGCVPNIRQDMVKIGMGTADIRFRGEFVNWYADLRIRYDATLYQLGYLVNIINAAGFKCGVGEWRVEKDGQFGMFHVESVTAE
jgi:hypothetical protein